MHLIGGLCREQGRETFILALLEAPSVEMPMHLLMSSFMFSSTSLRTWRKYCPVDASHFTTATSLMDDVRHISDYDRALVLCCNVLRSGNLDLKHTRFLEFTCYGGLHCVLDGGNHVDNRVIREPLPPLDPDSCSFFCFSLCRQ